MNRIAIILNVLVVSAVVFMGMGEMARSKEIKKQAEALQTKIHAMNKHIDGLSYLKDKPLEDALQYYRGLHEDASVFTDFYGLKMDSGLAGMPMTEASAWEGVRQLTVKFGFSGAIARGQYLRIFSFLEGTQQRYQLDIIRIDQRPNGLAVVMRIYGK